MKRGKYFKCCSLTIAILQIKLHSIRVKQGAVRAAVYFYRLAVRECQVAFFVEPACAGSPSLQLRVPRGKDPTAQMQSIYPQP